MLRRVIRIVSAASGTLIQNTSRQSIEVSRPPSTGPRAAKKAEAPARMPRALPRRSSGNTALTSAMAVGIISAAPMPWVARTVIIQTMSWAPPASAVEIRKITAPTRNTRRMPSRSPRRPPRTMNAARGRMLAVNSHWPRSRSAFRPWTTSGVASGTAVWSTRIMLLASVIPTSVSHIDRLLICIA